MKKADKILKRGEELIEELVNSMSAADIAALAAYCRAEGFKEVYSWVLANEAQIILHIADKWTPPDQMPHTQLRRGLLTLGAIWLIAAGVAWENAQVWRRDFKVRTGDLDGELTANGMTMVHALEQVWAWPFDGSDVFGLGEDERAMHMVTVLRNGKQSWDHYRANP